MLQFHKAARTRNVDMLSVKRSGLVDCRGRDVYTIGREDANSLEAVGRDSGREVGGYGRWCGMS